MISFAPHDTAQRKFSGNRFSASPQSYPTHLPPPFPTPIILQSSPSEMSSSSPVQNKIPTTIGSCQSTAELSVVINLCGIYNRHKYCCLEDKWPFKCSLSSVGCCGGQAARCAQRRLMARPLQQAFVFLALSLYGGHLQPLPAVIWPLTWTTL